MYYQISYFYFFIFMKVYQISSSMAKAILASHVKPHEQISSFIIKLLLLLLTYQFFQILKLLGGETTRILYFNTCPHV